MIRDCFVSCDDLLETTLRASDRGNVNGNLNDFVWFRSVVNIEGEVFDCDTAQHFKFSFKSAP